MEAGHIQRVRFLIESHEKHRKALYRISGLMRCGGLVVARLRSMSLGMKWERDVALLGLAAQLEKKVKKHLKGCKTCRIAKKRMKASA